MCETFIWRLPPLLGLGITKRAFSLNRRHMISHVNDGVVSMGGEVLVGLILHVKSFPAPFLIEPCRAKIPPKPVHFARGVVISISQATFERNVACTAVKPHVSGVHIHPLQT
jgi:hypothetical protein